MYDYSLSDDERKKFIVEYEEYENKEINADGSISTNKYLMTYYADGDIYETNATEFNKQIIINKMLEQIRNTSEFETEIKKAISSERKKKFIYYSLMVTGLSLVVKQKEIITPSLMASFSSMLWLKKISNEKYYNIIYNNMLKHKYYLEHLDEFESINYDDDSIYANTNDELKELIEEFGKIELRNIDIIDMSDLEKVILNNNEKQKIMIKK